MSAIQGKDGLVKTCPHLPYSPDLALCDFGLFPKVEKNMKSKHSDDRATKDAEDNLQDCFRKGKSDRLSVSEVSGNILLMVMCLLLQSII